MIIGKNEEGRYMSIEEKLVVVNKNKKFNQVVILAGGAGSGKGFSTKKFTSMGDSYRILDVDELKVGLLKLKNLEKRYPEISGLELRNPSDVGKLHSKIAELGWQKSQLNALMKSVISADPRRKPNLLFDQTARNLKKVQDQIDMVIELGYKPEDIHIIWAFGNFNVAITRNRNRARVVPEDILMGTHEGAAKTMFTIIKDAKKLNNFDGEFYVINTTSNVKAVVEAKAPEGSFKGTKETKKKKAKIEGGSFPIEKFLYVKIKSRGKPVDYSPEVEKTLFQWIINNAPKTKKTGSIFDAIKAKYPEIKF